MAKNPVRILHCIPSLGAGGAERQLRLLLPELVKQGCACAIFAELEQSDIAALSAAGVTCFASPRGSAAGAFVALLGAIRSWKPDLVQTWLLKMDVLAGIAALLTGHPFVLAERASPPAYGSSPRERLRRWIGARAVAIVANSQTAMTVWPDHGNRRVIVNAIDRTALRDDAPEAGAAPPQEVRVILMVCRLDAGKDVGTVVAAMREVGARNRDARLVVLGDGFSRADLERQVAALELSGCVQFLGIQKNVGWWLKRAAVFVSSSLHEGQPNAVLEAAASGVPLVLSAIAAHREMFSQAQAVFVATGDRDGFAHAIDSALTQSPLAQARASLARDAVRDRTAQACASAYKMLYDEIAS